MQASVYLDRAALWDLPDAMYGKYVHGGNPIFGHLHGSSWHGDDAKSVLFFVRHPVSILLISAAAACGAVCWALVVCRLKILGWRLRGAQPKGAPLIEVTTLKSS